MEYCAAGSLSDINEAIHRVLNEDELKATVAYTVLGLHHLHTNRSIHRVIITYYPLVPFHLNCGLGHQSREYFISRRWIREAC
jgi:hypothetical protein